MPQLNEFSWTVMMFKTIFFFSLMILSTLYYSSFYAYKMKDPVMSATFFNMMVL